MRLFDYTLKSRATIVDVAGGRKLSYCDIYAQMAPVAKLFGNRRKVLVFCFCKNNLSALLSYLAALESGNTIALLDDKVGPPQKGALISTYSPEFVISSDAAFSSGLKDLGYDPIKEFPDKFFMFKKKDDRVCEINKDTSVLLSTSGTTGSPKFVRLTYNNLLTNASSISASLNISVSEMPITSLPMHYSYGLSVINSHLYSGAGFVLLDGSVIEKKFWNYFNQFSCSSFSGVPYTYQLLRRIGFEKLELPSMRSMTQAGGNLDNETILRFHGHLLKQGRQFFVMYGQTEASPRMTCLPSRMLPEKVGSAGFAIPDGKITIEKSGRICECSETGEVVYSGPNVMLGYAQEREDLKKGDELQGMLHTGDIGHLDEDGCLYITGRNKRFAKAFGLRINLDEVEGMLKHNGPIAAIAGAEKIIVFSEQGRKEELVLLQTEISKILKIHPSAFEFRAIDKLPLKSSGKIDYSALESSIK